MGLPLSLSISAPCVAPIMGFRLPRQTREPNAPLVFDAFGLVFGLLSLVQPDEVMLHLILMHFPYIRGTCRIISWPTRQASAPLDIDVQHLQPESLHCCLCQDRRVTKASLEEAMFSKFQFP
jgi:hypothetical protein